MPRLTFTAHADVVRQLADMIEWHWDEPLSFVGFCEFVYYRHGLEEYDHINDSAVHLVALFTDYCMPLDDEADEEQETVVKH